MQSLHTQYRDPVFFMPARPNRSIHVIDLCVFDSSGTLRGRCSGQTLVELGGRYPGIELGEFDLVLAEKERQTQTSPEEISQRRYIQALEAMPPMHMRSAGGWESFRMSERYSGRVTAVYATNHRQYFTFLALDTLTHEDIVRQIQSTLGPIVPAPAA
jgi:hypothetical protein